MNRLLRRTTRGLISRAPAPIRRWAARGQARRWLRKNFDYDRARFEAASALLGEPSRVNLRSLLTMDYHRIEKGLSLAAPRPGFGQDVADRLARDVLRYLRDYGPDATTLAVTTALREYVAFQDRHGAALGDLGARIDAALAEAESAPRIAPSASCPTLPASTLAKTRAELHADAKIDLSRFFASRHSVRDFSDEPVDVETLRRSVAMAIRTPSVCNRQAWRVYTVETRRETEAVLACQNGNRGFRDRVQRVLVVACDLSGFVSVGERNQAWVDGGMFSMSLIYALHSEGLGTCALNWSATLTEDLRLRRTLPIAETDVIIMMLAVGHLPETFRVAGSPRKGVDETLIPVTISAPA